MTSELFAPLPLRSGQVLKNRIAKAAMEENIAGDGQLPDEQVRHQMGRLARGSNPRPGTPPAIALVSEQRKQRKALRNYRTWLSKTRGAA